MRSHFLLLLLVAFTGSLGAGCDAPKYPPAPASVPAPGSSTTNDPGLVHPLHLDRAQPKLATIKLWVGTKETDAEMCLTMQQLATGLMFRPGISGNDSMLFVFPKPQKVAFYMKNVGFDIDAAYIDADGIIQQIVRLKKMDATTIYANSDQIQYVLETAPGWFEQNGIGVGALVKSTKRSLPEEFGFN